MPDTLLSTPSISTTSSTAPVIESKVPTNCMSTPYITAPVEPKAPTTRPKPGP
ncbi:hypothetical protein AZE42_11066 [Rhizopogon vesiculosus]|uniref:Uncharacterized protein n=1 Tax=Rhizopogon vesiculosus TaxID=180088 RepID=A0A1J8QS52_9AGAM|nr:hypothetical protein AZE42_11066 [Rhizopogon vesiculosus]